MLNFEPFFGALILVQGHNLYMFKYTLSENACIKISEILAL